MSSAKRVTLMFSVNVSRLSQTPPNEVLNAPSKELKTSGFGLTSLAFGYFLFSTSDIFVNENENENENYCAFVHENENENFLKNENEN
jgi:hypothetical protein